MSSETIASEWLLNNTTAVKDIRNSKNFRTDDPIMTKLYQIDSERHP